MNTTERSPAIQQRRNESQPNQLDVSAKSWLGELPPAFRPLRTVESFPRIANQLAKLWAEDRACRAYFDELLLDNRGGRRGFPAHIALELAALKSYYESKVFPVAQTVWDELAARLRG